MTLHRTTTLAVGGRPSLRAAAALVTVLALGCDDGVDPGDADAGPLAPLTGVHAPLGQPLASTDDWESRVAHGRELASAHFGRRRGFGTNYTAARCISCHLYPAAGGKGGYVHAAIAVRDLLSNGEQISNIPGGFSPLYSLSAAAPLFDVAREDIIARRCAPAIAGAGLLASVLEEAVYELQDERDLNGDGISGRANFAVGFLGRFGRKAQVTVLEHLVRGQLFVHQGLTTDSLGDLRESLPDAASVVAEAQEASDDDVTGTRAPQFVNPELATTDDDGVTGAEISDEELIDLLVWTTLLAAPRPSEPTEQTREGEILFSRTGCDRCHVAELPTPHGTIAPYTDLLLHDMGSDLGDRVIEGVASGQEFRTAPLWTAGLGGPYLSDCSASTLEEAILRHGGEAANARDRFEVLSSDDQERLLAFVRSLGGELDLAERLAVPADGWGSAPSSLSGTDLESFGRGRRLFVERFRVTQGLGPELSGESCAGCHAWPGFGGAGDRDGDSYRQGTIDADGFTAPSGGSYLPRVRLAEPVVRPSPEAGFVTRHAAPSLVPARYIERAAQASLEAHADEADADSDGVSGRLAALADGTGRFGWKAQYASLREAVRACAARHMGLTSEGAPVSSDDDDVADPELSSEDVDDLATYVTWFEADGPATDDDGRAVFDRIGCASCHVPELTAEDGSTLTLYSDLLLHQVSDRPDVAEGAAEWFEVRTPPLWGLAHSAPYWHDGRAETLEDAIAAHTHEAADAATAFGALSAADREALLRFLSGL